MKKVTFLVFECSQSGQERVAEGPAIEVIIINHRTQTFQQVRLQVAYEGSISDTYTRTDWLLRKEYLSWNEQ